ncbi:MAG: M28 family peptidase [Bacteroidota bacterium]
MNKTQTYVLKVDKERIYQTITKLEGPRFPLDNMDALNATADYIADKLTAYGLVVEIQEFKVEGFDEPFKNVIGYLGDRSKHAILLGSHYDTVQNCPGANDNLSGVAISMEVVRVLADMEDPPSVIFAAFTLEEGHPFIAKQVREECLKYGLFDSKFRFTSTKMQEFNKTFYRLYRKYFQQGNNGVAVIEAVKKELEGRLSKDEKLYLDILIMATKSVADKSSFSIPHYLVGSNHYVKNVVQEKTKIKAAIVIDTVGWIKNEHHTQKILPFPQEMTRLFKVDLENEIGNFVGVFGDNNSSGLLNEFLTSCEDSMIDIPYYGVDVPFDYHQMAKKIPDLLRSDNAPFWEAGIPALFLMDTANFRSELYHTPADTSAAMNFETLLKVAQATVKTILEGRDK